MGCTQAAIDVFEASRLKGTAGGIKPVWYAPGKASNCGGVAVSGLEMSQNSQRTTWSAIEVDERLRGIMTECFKICLESGSQWGDVDEKGNPGAGRASGVLPSLVVGANVAGFIKVCVALIFLMGVLLMGVGIS